MGIDELTAKLAETTSLTPAPWLFHPLLRLLAEGEPVSVEDLAHAIGRPIGEVRQTLAALPDVEIDHRGRVVGYGLTLLPTPHRFEVDGRQLYTWCALDTLDASQPAQPRRQPSPARLAVGHRGQEGGQGFGLDVDRLARAGLD
jgi:hypothetical protein